MKVRIRSRKIYPGVTANHINSHELPIEENECDLFPDDTAVIIVDMWDKHWCSGATQRCKEIALKINPLIKSLRNRGFLIIHAPSDTLSAYKTHPARLHLFRELPSYFRWFYLLKYNPWLSLQMREKPFPIDDSDGGCFDNPPCKQGNVWKGQTDLIEINDNDIISDNGIEIRTLLRQKKIKNVIFMGVHTNMCVLGRSFGIRRMVKWGFKPLLCRDLTDTMYNPKSWPFVPHDEGTARVVAHIERFWCPSIESNVLLE